MMDSGHEQTTLSKRSRSDSITESRAVGTSRGSSPESDPKKVATEANAVSSTFSGPQQDEKGRVLPYDASSEQLPRLAPFFPAFEYAESAYTQACDSVPKAYEEAKADGYCNKDIERVCANLANSRSPSSHYPTDGKLPVATLGPAGHGKSSAMNSIMSRDNVAFADDGDERGTYVPHEYAYIEPDQTAPYRLVAVYKDSSTIDREVGENYQIINGYLFETDEAASEDEGTEEEEQKYKTAMCFFIDVLGSRREFKDDDSTATYFRNKGYQEPQSKGYTDVRKQLCGLVKEFQEDRCDELYPDRPQFNALRVSFLQDNEERHDVHTQSELQEKLGQICRPPRIFGKARSGSPWPLLRKVTVHQDIGLLKAGVVLADLPGINDENLTIVRSAIRSLKESGAVFIFFSYRRMTTGRELTQMLRDAIALGKINKIWLIVTHIDEMKLLKEDTMNPEQKASLLKAEMTNKSLAHEIEETKTAMRQAKGTGAKSQELDASRKLQTLTEQKRRAAAAIKQTVVEIRCQDLREKNKNKIKEISKSRKAPELRSLFISNTEYQRHVIGYDPEDAEEAPFLDLEATGIPALRRELFAFPTHGKLDVLKSLAETQIPNMLLGIKGILTKTKLERMKEIRTMITTRLGKPTKPVNELSNHVGAAYDKHVAYAIANKLSEWKNDAREKLWKWAGGHKPPAFKVLCSKKGDWCNRRTKVHTSWNNDLICISSGTLFFAFEELGDELDSLIVDFSENFHEFFRKLIKGIKQSRDAQGSDLDSFFSVIRSTGQEVVAQITNEFSSLQVKLDYIRHSATLDSMEDSYIKKGMLEAYEKASNVSKASKKTKMPVKPVTISGGKKPRTSASLGGTRAQILLEKLCGEEGNEDIFSSLNQSCADDFIKAKAAFQSNCNKVVKGGFDKILQYFDNSFQEDEVEEDPNPAAVEKIKMALEHANAKLEVMRGHIEECDAYEKN